MILVSNVSWLEGGDDGLLTSCPSAAHGAVAGVVRLASDVAHAGVQEALAAEVFAEEVLDAPEAAGGESGFLRAFGDGHAGLAGAVGAEAHCERREGSGQALQE